MMIRSLSSAVVLIALPLAAGAGTPPFSFSTRTDLTTLSSVAVVSADFNGDHIADLAVIGAGSVQIYLGKGNCQFAAPTLVPLGGQPNSYIALCVADINNDGKPDLVVSGSKTLIFFGNGDGTFTAGPTISTAGLPVLAADFNLDGNQDLAIDNGNAVEVLLGDGKGGFSAPTVLSGATGCLAVGDFNRDGKPDVIGCGLNSVSVYLGKGDGTFQAPINSAIPSSAIYATVGDLNGDGKLDVAAAATFQNGSNPSLGPVYVLYGNGDGTFQPALQVHTNIGPVFSVGIGDLNGDGLPDLVAAGLGGIQGAPYVGSLVGTYFNQGAGKGFAKQQVYPVTFISSLPWQAMLVTDLTGDQQPDVVVTDNGGVFFSILFNNGNGQLKDVRSLNLAGVTAAGVLFGSPTSVAQEDFNGDGLGDLAVLTSKNGQYAVKVFVGTGKSNAPFRVGPSTALATQGTFAPFSMVAGDFNGDGKVDLAIGFSNLLFTSSFVHVYLGNGDGTFAAGSKFSVPITGQQMIAADLNGDGKLDLASSSGFVALGNGDGTFQNPTTFYTISPLDNTLGTWLGAADFNHDGKLDLAFQTPEDVSNGQPLLIFLGNGDGTFQNPVSYTWGFLPAWGALVDLNRDGNPDVVILSAEHPHDQIAVFLGNADGSFQAPSFLQLPFAVYPTSIVATDLNGDGKVDLAVMDDGGNALYLFAGNGDGTFGSGVEIGAASTLLWLGFGNYQGQTTPGFADLVTFDGALNTFFSPSSTAGVAVSTLLNTGQK